MRTLGVSSPSSTVNALTTSLCWAALSREAELGVFGGDADGAGHGHFEAAAEGEAVEGGQDGLAEGFELAEQGLAFL